MSDRPPVGKKGVRADEVLTVIYHPDDEQAVRRAWDELYPHEQPRCFLYATPLVPAGRIIVNDPHKVARTYERIVSWMREATDVYRRNPTLGQMETPDAG